MNEPYEPKQNGKVKRFHQTMKREFFQRQGLYQTEMEEINYRCRLWLGNYNNKRRHGGLGMNRMTPAEKIKHAMLQSLANTYVTYPQKVTPTLQQRIF